MALTFLVNKLSLVFFLASVSNIFFFGRLRVRVLDTLVVGAGDSGRGVWSIIDMAKWMCCLMAELVKCLSIMWRT